MTLVISRSPDKVWYGILLLSCILFSSYAIEGQCSPDDQQFLVTFHPHLDAFWLNTDDQLKNINFRPQGFLYNMNQRNSKQIFNSMYDALIQDEKRKYFITEIVFFKDWYQYLSDEKKTAVKKMLKNGQIDIVNSGWVENDEAVCYYDDVLDQYTIGMNWMYEQFGYINRIGWATDSFGHSHSQVALQYLLGFQFQGIERIDDRYIYQRKQKPLLQFYWQPVSDSNGRKYGGVLNQIRHFLHEVNDLRRVPSQSIANDFQTLEKKMKQLYGKNKFFRFLGNDFEQFNTEQFVNLQKAFVQLNRNSNKDCPTYRYGNPKDYLEIVKPHWSQNKLQIRQNDFIPNWDQDRYWSGYYTTDPQLKIICKSFSRLVNLVRKRMVKTFLADKTVYSTHNKTLQQAQELLSIMQHHDGITATSKSYIQTAFKQKMALSSQKLIQVIANVDKINSQQVCKLFENRNSCNLTQKQEKLTLSILHEGVTKKEKIELILPDRFIYTVDGIQSFVVLSPAGYTYTFFEAELKSGKNDFVLKGQQKSQFKGQIKQFKNSGQSFDNKEGIKVTIGNNSLIQYSFGQNFMHFSFVSSANNPSRRQTVAWNKYGQKNDKTQTVIPGIYIMSNDGKITSLNQTYSVIQVLQLGGWYRVFLDGHRIDLTLTFSKQDPSQVDCDFIFKPNGYNMLDYFLKVDSNIINKQNQFFHDSNGYLVAKRKIGYRPDYDWIYKPQDKINANTYPACTFFYQTNGQQKFIAFLDRAQGITTYDGSMMINIDRLAADDYKGVGEGYSFVKENRFSFKFAITSSNDDLQRIWQRAYDDSLLGFITTQQPSKNQVNLKKTSDNGSQYLKYTVTFLNKEQILLRLHNLAERSDVKLPVYGAKSWILSDLDLSLSYSSIRQSFANGLILKQRYNWVEDSQEINYMTRSLDSVKQITLRPLEIRSFRININSQITDREQGNKQERRPLQSEVSAENTEQTQVLLNKALVRHSLRKKCF